MSSFIARALLVILIGSIYIDLTYGGFSWGTPIVGVLFLVTFIYWLRTSPTITLCKACGHDRYKHNRTLECHDPVGIIEFTDVCLELVETTHDECGCWRFTPKWKFWDRKQLWIRGMH